MSQARLGEGEIRHKLAALQMGETTTILAEASGCTEAELLAIAADELCEYRGVFGDEEGDFLEFERPAGDIGVVRQTAARELLRRLASAAKCDELQIELSLLRDAFGDGYVAQWQDRLNDLVRSEWRTVSGLMKDEFGSYFVVSSRTL